MKTSDAGIAMIKKFEGLRLAQYQDDAGFWTIGWGHRIKSGENTLLRVTQAQADKLFALDLAHAEHGVLKATRDIELTQGQFDALVSFVYNLGYTSLKNSTLLKKMQGGDMEGASREFSRWVHAGGKVLRGLVLRRQAEADLFRGVSSSVA